MLAKRQRHAADDLVEQLFGFRRIVGPDAGMKLDSGARGQDGGFRVGIRARRAARRAARLRIRTSPRCAGRACTGARCDSSLARRGLHFRFEERAQFDGHAGKQNDDVAVRFEPEAGRGAAWIGKHGGAFGDHGLARVDFRHGAAEASKAFLNLAEDFVIAAEFAAEKIGDGVARAVIVGGAKAAAKRRSSRRGRGRWKTTSAFRRASRRPPLYEPRVCRAGSAPR